MTEKELYRCFIELKKVIFREKEWQITGYSASPTEGVKAPMARLHPNAYVILCPVGRTSPRIAPMNGDILVGLENVLGRTSRPTFDEITEYIPLEVAKSMVVCDCGCGKKFEFDVREATKIKKYTQKLIHHDCFDESKHIKLRSYAESYLIRPKTP